MAVVDAVKTEEEQEVVSGGHLTGLHNMIYGFDIYTSHAMLKG